MIVLIHLILNDMIKVKGQISEMALVLEDEDAAIAEKARYFFLQLSKKVCIIIQVLKQWNLSLYEDTPELRTPL